MAAVSGVDTSLATGKKSFRPIPCLDYDMEAMESWLDSMAEKGYFLSERGFLFGLAMFERGKPYPVRYRLSARKGIPWDAPLPSGDEKELYEAYGWQYLTDWNQYHIYCTSQETARELHTEPKIQALAVEKVIRRQWGHILYCLVVLAVNPGFKSMLLWTWSRTGNSDETGWLICCLLAIVCGLGQAAVGLLYSYRIYARLAAGESLDHRKDWKRRSRFCIAERITMGLIFLSCIAYMLAHLL